MMIFSPRVCSTKVAETVAPATKGGTDLIVDHQNLVERYGIAGLSRQLLDEDHVVRGDLILLAAAS